VIDFRYHLVSLISVFLALAVGIILGAGPLKETIGDSLTGQVEALRVEKEEMREALQNEQNTRGEFEEYVTASSKRLVKDALVGRRIAVLQLGEVSDERFDSVEQQVTYAGATVPARVAISNSWVDPEQANSRVSYASSLTQFLPEDKKDLTPEKQLAAALVLSLSQTSATSVDNLSSNAELALEVLDGAQLVELVRYTPEPVDAVIILDGSNITVSDTDETPDFGAASSLYMNIAEAAARGTEGVVVSTSKVVDTDLVSTIRQNASMLKMVATVSDVDTPVGLVNTPLALSAGIGGKVGHFGFESSATALVPAAVTLDPPAREVTPVEQAEATDPTDAQTDAPTDASGEADDGEADS